MRRGRKQDQPRFHLLSMLVEQCPLTQEEVGRLFGYVHEDTEGKPCVTGCAFFDGGKCPSFQRLKQASALYPESLIDGSMGMMALVTALSAQSGINQTIFCAALLACVAEDPLNPPRGSSLWDKVKAAYPLDGGEIDTEALMVAIKQTISNQPALKPIGVVWP